MEQETQKEAKKKSIWEKDLFFGLSDKFDKTTGTKSKGVIEEIKDFGKGIIEFVKILMEIVKILAFIVLIITVFIGVLYLIRAFVHFLIY